MRAGSIPAPVIRVHSLFITLSTKFSHYSSFSNDRENDNCSDDNDDVKVMMVVVVILMMTM